MQSVHNLLRLDDKIALVTGSNRGIGSAIAFALAEYGAEVIVHCSRDVSRAQAVADEINARYGTPTHAIAVDLAHEDAGHQLFEQVSERVSQVDILVLNASVQVRKPWAEITPDEFDLQMNVNFRASVISIQRFLPTMIERGWGRVVTVGSVQQIKPHPEMMIYAATKDAQMSVVRNLAKQVSRFGVTINNLAPGVIDTDRNVEALSNDAYREVVKANIPTHTIGEAHDCAGATLLLCSEAGRYITGENLVVDGGMQL